MKTKLRFAFSFVLSAGLFSPQLRAQPLFSDNFDTDHSANWTVNASAGTHPVNLFFDYGAIGIPSAPNSGGTTIGLRLQANTSGATFGGVSVSPTGQSFTGDYQVRFDMWLNYNGTLSGGGNGSTQVTGAGIGTAGASPQWAGGTQDSVHFGATGDGGSTVDYRISTRPPQPIRMRPTSSSAWSTTSGSAWFRNLPRLAWVCWAQPVSSWRAAANSHPRCRRPVRTAFHS